VQLHAIAHGNHHFAFVKQRAKVGALTLWSGCETGDEEKPSQSEEKRDTAYFTDGTHKDSPGVTRMVGIFLSEAENITRDSASHFRPEGSGANEKTSVASR
jgi:hypothetical protein